MEAASIGRSSRPSSRPASCHVDRSSILADVITNVVNNHPNSRIDELLPLAYQTTKSSKPWPETSAYDRKANPCRHRSSEISRRLETIPGIDPIASATAATVG